MLRRRQIPPLGKRILDEKSRIWTRPCWVHVASAVHVWHSNARWVAGRGLRMNEIQNDIVADSADSTAAASKPLRRLYFGDNLEVMGRLPDGLVDLVYLDPPFKSDEDYNVFFETE